MTSSTNGPSPAAVPRSKTWSVLSTIHKLPTAHHASHPTTASRPTTIASTVQSIAGILSPRHSLANKGRLSRPCPQRQHKALGPKDAHPADGSTEQPELPDNTLRGTTTGSSSIKMLTADGYPATWRREVVLLKMPTWDHHGVRAGNSGASGAPRRSKRSQRNAANGQSMQESPKPKPATSKLGLMDDDVSPTSSAGPVSPRLTSPPTDSNAHGPAAPGNQSATSDVSVPEALSKALEARSVEACQVATPSNDVAEKGLPKDRLDETAASSSLDTREIRKPRSSVTTNGTNSKQLDNNDNEDHEAPVTCSLFFGPFRRSSLTVASPVRERVRTFERLGKTSRCPRAASRDKTNREGSKSQNSISDPGKPSNKKRSLAWIPRTLRKMSVHRGKDRRPSHASTDEGTRPTSLTSEECQAECRSFDKSALSATRVFEKRREPDTSSFTPPSSRTELRP